MNWQSLGLEVTRPLALWGLALALSLVVFHLYHRRRVKVVVPFLPLLVESTGPARRDARFKRLRELFALLLLIGVVVPDVLNDVIDPGGDVADGRALKGSGEKSGAVIVVFRDLARFVSTTLGV